MIKKHPSIIEAETVFKALSGSLTFRKWQKQTKGRLSMWLECFDNCREQGLVLKLSPYGTNIAVTQNRNSDDIVVYRYSKTSFPSNLPDEDSWNDKKYFRYGDYEAAAIYIESLLIEIVSKEVKR